jgi:hypothetical protein
MKFKGASGYVIIIAPLPGVDNEDWPYKFDADSFA